MGPLSSIPWYASFDRALPLSSSAADILAASSLFDGALSEAGIELVAMQARLLFPEQFNQRVESCGSKASALTLWTLELIEQIIAPLGDTGILMQCDKHGARNHYAPLLQHVFPEYLIEVREEAQLRSIYRWGPAARRVEARFAAKGERFMPCALASMMAKYLRELAMLAFNEFWQSHLSGLRPTAGYPVDARRFCSEIQATQRQLGIGDQILWRTR